MEERRLDLSILLGFLRKTPAYQEVVAGVAQGVQAVVLEGAKPYLLAALFQELRLPLLVITSRSEAAHQLQEQLPLWCPAPTTVQLFPEPDALPYERLSPDITTVQERLRTLSLLVNKRPKDDIPIVITSAWAAAYKTIPHPHFAQACHAIRSGMRASPLELVGRWQELGYRLEATVEMPGEMSHRGGLVDIFPPNSPLPFRLEFLGNEIESIRSFDPATQRSLTLTQEIHIIPAREMLVRPDSLESFLNRCGVGERMEEELTRLREGQGFPGEEFYAPLFNQGSFFDYLPQPLLIVLDEPEELKAELEEMERRAQEEREGRGELPPHFPAPFLSWPEFSERIESLRPQLRLSRWGGDGMLQLPFSPLPNYRGQWPLLVRELRERRGQSQPVVLVSHQAARLAELLAEEGIGVSAQTSLTAPPRPGELKLISGSVAQGWALSQPPLLLLSDGEVFGWVKQRRSTKRRPLPGQALLAEINPGDYVVHGDYGIARYGGLSRLQLEGEEKEYLVLHYAEGDKLYVPVEQAERVSRYVGAGGQPPALSRLRSPEWQRTRRRVSEAALELARELLKLYASRHVLPGFAFSPDNEWQWELEASFPYVETADQERAVVEVKRDMEKPYPMDRLVCGDVGYGKTEVALRGAFKAVMDGRQVAVLVPTTVLAQQHFDTFSKRLAPFPVKVAMLSRFLSPKEQQQVVAGLTTGQVDICIGTHRLLQRDVAFKDLGLVIIDEEQRFGVRHKERLKQMRQEVDVLTLTATPIPRTLNMALSGVRDMSTMETPPEERLPIKTYVAEYDERLIREAILRELERGGQVFFVHNRVESIRAQAAKLRQLLPEAQFAIGHGQMDEEELEGVMADFAQGKQDVLICTTIIESGLDMPNVNTLIVNEADRLGLTQLYQLRGRVGRGGHRAYAYFLYNRGKRLTPQATKRLETVYQATELGAGFRIALRDLEIRGAGNLLGPEQSGNIGAVGYDLYSQLLSQAVEELKAQQQGRPYQPPPPTPSLSLPLPAYIPEEYIQDERLRLDLYQRLARISGPDQLKALEEEFQDRFGSLPDPLENLLYIIAIKLLATEAGVESIASQDRQIVLTLRAGQKAQKSWQAPGVRVGVSKVRLDLKTLGPAWPERLKTLLQAMPPILIS